MPLEITAYGATDKGRRRKNNEDSFLVDPELNVYAVADGMGGHQGGEVASAHAIDAFRRYVAEHRDVFDRLAEEASPDNRLAAQIVVDRAVQAASADVYAFADKNQQYRGMGTTFVGLVAAGTCAVLGHVGDSRIYLVRKGHVHRLTEDHTFVEAQLRSGQITPEEAAVSPYQRPRPRRRHSSRASRSTRWCSSSSRATRSSSAATASTATCPTKRSRRSSPTTNSADLPAELIALANTRGGKDNITAVVVRTTGEGADDTVDAGAKMDAVEQLPLFNHFTYKERAAMLSVSHSRQFAAGETIVAEGSVGEEFFVVVRGRVIVEKAGVEMATLGAGGHFGEMGLVESQPRSATVRATEPTRVVTLGQADVMNLMRREPNLSVKLLWSLVQVMSQRLRAANAGLSEAKLELADQQRATFPKFGE